MLLKWEHGTLNNAITRTLILRHQLLVISTCFGSRDKTVVLNVIRIEKCMFFFIVIQAMYSLFDIIKMEISTKHLQLQ